MAMDLATFRASFPEFTRAPDTLVLSRLAWATARTPIEIWGDLQDQGIGFLAAHFLSIDPNAKELRKDQPAGAALDSTAYGRERRRLNSIVSSGYRTAGTTE